MYTTHLHSNSSFFPYVHVYMAGLVHQDYSIAAHTHERHLNRPNIQCVWGVLTTPNSGEQRLGHAGIKHVRSFILIGKPEVFNSGLLPSPQSIMG